MQKDETNIQNSKEIEEKIFNSEEYYSIEDYATLITIKTCFAKTKIVEIFSNSTVNLNENKEMINTTIRANFLVDGKEKEIILDKNILNKIYAFSRIYSENGKFVNILILRTEKYDTKDILKKINEIRFFKGAFKIQLNINEFPIKTYYLEEIISQNKEKNTIDVEKEFILKKINLNNINQNNINIVNFQNLNETMTNLINNSPVIANKANTMILINKDNNISDFNNNNINDEVKINNNNFQANNKMQIDLKHIKNNTDSRNKRRNDNRFK